MSIFTKLRDALRFAKTYHQFLCLVCPYRHGKKEGSSS